MPVAALVSQVVGAAVGAGHGDQDFAALILEQARNSGYEIESENADIDDGLGTAEAPAPDGDG
jgi:3-hydroxyisobutyrate dehydrogenase